MGNNVGPGGNIKGMQAVARTTPNIELTEFQLILSDLKTVASETASDWISREAFDAAIRKIDKFEAPDIDIFVKLFTLYDVQGNNTVDYKDYVAGAACCLCTASNSQKLAFAMPIYDSNMTKCLLKGDLKKLLHTINNVTSFFGDPVIRPNQIDTLIFDVYKAFPSSAGRGVEFESCIEALLAHDIVKMFLNGEGRLRFGDPELRM